MKKELPRSNWTVLGLLGKLPAFKRVDRGDDRLAFRISGDAPGRTAYVRLSVDEPAAIHFDLEDPDAVRPTWDLGCEQGCVDSPADLAVILRWWLADPALA